MAGSYQILQSKIIYVIESQDGVLNDNLVTIITVDPVQFRPATQEDQLQAIDVKMTTEALKDIAVEISNEAQELANLYKLVNVFNAGKKNQEIEFHKKLISIKKDGIEKFTKGKTLNDYLNQYVPNKLKDFDKTLTL
jgi:hypothetical protein